MRSVNKQNIHMQQLLMQMQRQTKYQMPQQNALQQENEYNQRVYS